MSVPYVIEGEGQKEKVYDLYSRLLKDRIIFIGREFMPDLANSVAAQLLFLESDNSEKPINIYINSPGGYVTSMLTIFDTMNYINPDVSTMCIGQAASAAAFILASGAKGERYALKNSRIMIHQISGGSDGHIADVRIDLQELELANKKMIEELARATGHSVKKILKDIDRDRYMSAEEAKEYGLIDRVLEHRV